MWLKLVTSMLRCLLLLTAIWLIAIAASTPGTQLWQAMLGGFCGGLYSATDRQ